METTPERARGLHYEALTWLSRKDIDPGCGRGYSVSPAGYPNQHTVLCVPLCMPLGHDHGRLGSDIRARQQRRNRCYMAWLGQSLAPVMAAADSASGFLRNRKALVLCDLQTLSPRRGAVLPLAELVDGMKARPHLCAYNSMATTALSDSPALRRLPLAKPSLSLSREVRHFPAP